MPEAIIGEASWTIKAGAMRTSTEVDLEYIENTLKFRIPLFLLY